MTFRLDIAHAMSEEGAAANWDHALEIADRILELPTISAMNAALFRLLSLRRQILIDIGARHAARLKTADDLTIQLDADFRRELEEAFAEAAQGMAGEAPRREGGSAPSGAPSPVRRMRPDPVSTPQQHQER